MNLKRLVIAEKPSVGRDIARVIGAGRKADGYIESENYIVSWAIGHLVTLYEPEDYAPSLKRWTMESLPIIPDAIRLKPIKTAKKQFDILKRLMNDAGVSEIICATDAGREGELIFRYVYSLAACKKRVLRLWISSMTDAAIRAGFENLKPSEEYDALYLSAQCRSHADWLVGINATRAYTIRYNTLLSVGRVQTPTLAIITKRQDEINAFVPKDYWVLRAVFSCNKAKYTGAWIGDDDETAIYDIKKAERLKTTLAGKNGIVLSIKNEEKRDLPYLLYDLTSLQRDANAKYGFSAQKTLDIAQDLYEKRKYITYPRTDSKHITSDMTPKLRGVIEKLDIQPYTEFVRHILAKGELSVSKRIADDAKVSDHHAIIPTDMNFNTDKLTTDERRVFDLIVRRFLQAFYPPYVYSMTKLITSVESERFISKGKTVIDAGFTELYKVFAKEEDDGADVQTLPSEIKENVSVNTEDLHVKAMRTKPPKAYTEATLLSAMEHAGRFVEDETLREQMRESGLGTPATRAAVIERLITVGYIERKGKTLAPTQKGLSLIAAVPPELKSPETTGKWERGLAFIAGKKMEPQVFMDSIKRYVRYIVAESVKARTDIVFPGEQRKKGRTANANHRTR